MISNSNEKNLIYIEPRFALILYIKYKGKKRGADFATLYVGCTVEQND